ncbi:SDR family oxidoreductase [Desulfobacula sp.]|uniref:SDR family NAD(P)-dependent oxidoreductase n=1 Tax=Desulfobacula sp. TaxID=2593537 RepID=UPI002608E88E|nr:SDR family oxidoreductase [Desulfobacula sp.]
MMKPTIIIYGASGAIGSATAKILFDKGFRIHLVGRNPEKLADLASDLNAGITIGDVTDQDLFKRVNDDAGSEIGGIVYAVGTINLGSIRKFRQTDFLLDFKVNALGAAMAVQSALTKLKKNKHISSIVLFSSVAAQRGFSMHTSIAMAKGAVNGLTRSLAAELSPLIRVNAISPSITQTPLTEKILSNPSMAEAIKNKHPLNRLGTPEDMAALAAFLISEDAGWITGQIIGVDGGRSTIEVKG